MVNDRVNIAKRLRKTPEKLAKENFYDDASYKIEPLLFEMVYEIVCGSDEGSYDDVFIKAAELIETPEELGLFYCPRCGARILGTRYRKDDDSER